jgi:hypothetical protein
MRFHNAQVGTCLSPSNSPLIILTVAGQLYCGNESIFDVFGNQQQRVRIAKKCNRFLCLSKMYIRYIQCKGNLCDLLLSRCGRGLLHVKVSRSSHTSHVTRHTSHVTRHTSHVTRHTSHVTRHTSHVTRHTLQGSSFSLSRASPSRAVLSLF